MDFGATLRLLRENAGMSVDRLAERAGTSSSYVRALEDGRSTFLSRDRIGAIARVLRVPVHLLLELAAHHRAQRSDHAYRSHHAAVARGGASGRDARSSAPSPSDPPESDERIRAECVPSLAALLRPDRIALRASCIDFRDALDVAATMLCERGGAIQPARVADALLQHARDRAVAIGAGMALPHAIVPELAPRASLVTLETPTEVATPDGEPVRLLIALAIDPAKVRHVHLLARIARLAVPEVTEALCAATTPEDVLEMLGPALY